ncbi:DUF3696 domain-containing protein [Virgibacillus xinjiangensis]|uniref:DUF3696 domain-containing protein n=1 Tax=Virgibacillus xinjiangensis TaxID=393090 RepID=A0ABV7CW75_9BACI
MITNIGLVNFKIFKYLENIELAPITILSGQNSGGKSTIIQSLLLLKQTIENPVSDETLILNGAYISLGDFKDIFNNVAAEDEKLGFSITFRSNESELDNETYEIYDELNNTNLNDYSVIDLSLNYKNTSNTQHNIQDAPYLLNSTIKGEIEGFPFELSIDRKQNLRREILNKYDVINKKAFLDSPDLYSLSKCKGIELDFRREVNKKDIISVNTNTFLPDKLFCKFNLHLAKFKNEVLNNVITTILDSFPEVVDDSKKNKFNNYRLLKIYSRKLRNTPTTEEENNYTILQIEEYLETILGDFNLSEIYSLIKIFLYRMDNEKLDYILNYLSKSYNGLEQIRNMKENIRKLPINSLRISNDNKTLTNFRGINSYIRKRFASIYYLGPLREAPKVYYNRYGSHDPMYVGPRGENVAFVLKHYSKREITAILPPKNGEEFNLNQLIPEVTTLGEAVKEWLAYIGVAHEVSVNSVGKLGLSLQANVDGRSNSDLTNVGVGVSQVLPIIVLGLSSRETNTILLFEQPELHLHPYVQSRLGDFFVSLQMLGKQVIAETHSEYLINRMRLHIAKGKIRYNDDLKIYFCEKDEGDSAHFTKVQIDNYGSIDYYPEGFFDETEKQLEKIMLAAFERDDLHE